MEPFRAFVADLLPEEQRTRGFAVQSLFIGLGAIVASALPWMMTNLFRVQNAPATGHAIPLTVRFSFYVGAVAFLGAVIWTMVSTTTATAWLISTASRSISAIWRSCASGWTMPAN
jgi:maltose/moltooligosaccharide transporter